MRDTRYVEAGGPISDEMEVKRGSNWRRELANRYPYSEILLCLSVLSVE
jgi:hypothetical protein